MKKQVIQPLFAIVLFFTACGQRQTTPEPIQASPAKQLSAEVKTANTITKDLESETPTVAAPAASENLPPVQPVVIEVSGTPAPPPAKVAPPQDPMIVAALEALAASNLAPAKKDALKAPIQNVILATIAKKPNQMTAAMSQLNEALGGLPPGSSVEQVVTGDLEVYSAYDVNGSLTLVPAVRSGDPARVKASVSRIAS